MRTSESFSASLAVCGDPATVRTLVQVPQGRGKHAPEPLRRLLETPRAPTLLQFAQLALLCVDNEVLAYKAVRLVPRHLDSQRTIQQESAGHIFAALRRAREGALGALSALVDGSPPGAALHDIVRTAGTAPRAPAGLSAQSDIVSAHQLAGVVRVCVAEQSSVLRGHVLFTASQRPRAHQSISATVKGGRRLAPVVCAHDRASKWVPRRGSNPCRSNPPSHKQTNTDATGTQMFPRYTARPQNSKNKTKQIRTRMELGHSNRTSA